MFDGCRLPTPHPFQDKHKICLPVSGSLSPCHTFIHKWEVQFQLLYHFPTIIVPTWVVSCNLFSKQHIKVTLVLWPIHHCKDPNNRSSVPMEPPCNYLVALYSLTQLRWRETGHSSFWLKTSSISTVLIANIEYEFRANLWEKVVQATWVSTSSRNSKRPVPLSGFQSSSSPSR